MTRLLPLLLVACAEARLTDYVVVPAEGVRSVVAEVDRGSVVYAGTSPPEFSVTSERWGHGPTRGMAEEQARQTTATVRVIAGRLALTGISQAPNAGVDFVVEGPPDVDVDASLPEGDLHVEDVEGTVVGTAQAFYGRGLTGPLDVQTTAEGADIEAMPDPGEAIRLDVTGDLALALPYGAPYDLVVFPDPDFEVAVTDLGFDSLTVAPDFVRGSAGDGSIEVSVVVRSGAFTLWLPGSSAR